MKVSFNAIAELVALVLRLLVLILEYISRRKH